MTILDSSMNNTNKINIKNSTKLFGFGTIFVITTLMIFTLVIPYAYATNPPIITSLIADDPDNLDEFDFDQGDGFDEITPLFTGDTLSLPWPGGYDQTGFIFLTNSGVFPCTILATMPQVVTQDR